MIARDMTLSSLFDARTKLGVLIVNWAPDAAKPALTDQLTQLLNERDQVNGAINAIIDAEFKGIASPELLAAASSLDGLSKDLNKLGATVDDINKVLKVADQIVQAASKVLGLVTA